MNKYSSTIRTYTIRNYIEDTLTPGTDLVIPAPAAGVTALRTAPSFTEDVNQNTNIMIRKAGVFCNFADGLIFKDPKNRIDLDFALRTYVPTGDPYVVRTTYGSNIIMVTSGTPVWVGGGGGRRAINFNVTNGRIMYIDPPAGIPPVLSAPLEDYWQYSSFAGIGAQDLVSVGGGRNFTMRNISALNCMYEAGEFGEPFIFSAGADYSYIALHAAINWLDTQHTTPFLTDIIDSAFTGADVFFDIVVEVEFTAFH